MAIPALRSITLTNLCPWTGAPLLAHSAGMPLVSVPAPYWIFLLDHVGAHRNPFVVSWGCLCFPAPLGALHMQELSLTSSSILLLSPWGCRAALAPGHVQLSRLSLGALPIPAVTPSAFAQGIWCNTSRSFPFPEPSRASLASQGLLTISHTNLSCFSTSQSLFPQKISCNHPGVSLL